MLINVLFCQIVQYAWISSRVADFIKYTFMFFLSCWTARLIQLCCVLVYVVRYIEQWTDTSVEQIRTWSPNSLKRNHTFIQDHRIAIIFYRDSQQKRINWLKIFSVRIKGNSEEFKNIQKLSLSRLLKNINKIN